MDDSFGVLDPIHGFVQLSGVCRKIIDTATFQRLRFIQQSFGPSLVYPGFTSTRFSHCIGTGYLSRFFAETLKKNQPELEITSEDIEAVEVAGLCHDIGHGPFSHCFDGLFIPAVLPKSNWHHEDASLMLFDYMIDKYAIDLEQSQVKLIKDLIIGQHSSQSTNYSKKFLFDIVANKRNGLDTDKFDYIRRDCHYSGLKKDFDSTRLMTCARVIDNEICFQNKTYINIFDLFYNRYTMHRQIYRHKTCCAAEMMITDALIHAEPVLKLSESIYDPEKYVLLNDSIINEIERSQNAALYQSKAILERIFTRKFYSFAGEFMLDAAKSEQLSADIAFIAKLKEKMIATKTSYSAKLTSPVTDADFEISVVKFNFGMKSENPLDFVKFYDKSNPNCSFKIEASNSIGSVLADSMEECWLRCFVRSTETAKIDHLKDAFERLKIFLKTRDIL